MINPYEWKIHRRLDQARRVYICPARGNNKVYTQLGLYAELMTQNKDIKIIRAKDVEDAIDRLKQIPDLGRNYRHELLGKHIHENYKNEPHFYPIDKTFISEECYWPKNNPWLKEKEEKMKGDIYYLKDRDGQIGYKFVVEEDDFRLVGKCYEAYSWLMDGTPCEYSYIAGVYCKWDACTHWYFRGEDYETEGEADSYYHLCGGYSFMGHIIAMCFVWKLAEQIISESEHAKQKNLSGYINDEYYDHERIKQLIELVLNGYEIVKA